MWRPTSYIYCEFFSRTGGTNLPEALDERQKSATHAHDTTRKELVKTDHVCVLFVLSPACQKGAADRATIVGVSLKTNELALQKQRSVCGKISMRNEDEIHDKGVGFYKECSGS